MEDLQQSSKKIIEEKINQIIEEKINPILGQHLGGLQLTDFKDGVATVKFTGNCRSCAAAEETLESVVSDILLEEIPEVREVHLDQSVSRELLDFARTLLSEREEK